MALIAVGRNDEPEDPINRLIFGLVVALLVVFVVVVIVARLL